MLQTLRTAAAAFALLAPLAALAAEPTAPSPPTHIVGLDVKPGPDGLDVVSARPGFPAAAAGLQTGDVLRQLGPTPLADVAPLRAQLADGGGAPLTLLVQRYGGDPRFIAVRPLAFPDPERDRTLHPYPFGFVERPRFGVPLDGRVYEPVTPAQVFSMRRALLDGVGLGDFDPSASALLGRRLLLPSAITCRAVATPFFPMTDPADGVGPPALAVPSPLFDPAAAALEAARCRAYRAAHPEAVAVVGRVAGRFIRDTERLYGGGALIFLADAVYMEEAHVTAWDQAVGVVNAARDLFRMGQALDGLLQ